MSCLTPGSSQILVMDVSVLSLIDCFLNMLHILRNPVNFQPPDDWGTTSYLHFWGQRQNNCVYCTL